ncbi:hypothetical protein BCR39DRAFT_526084 [Naematelia encephala]|uniref:Uncharacterized protein n=1 Tax=Naematelia encephala TaxID=71784 RepID=A0A1Y2BAX2_9TREE|nr:hypothetical protein BCR39DRAFT_526084 [Naematelia encephala]
MLHRIENYVYRHTPHTFPLALTLALVSALELELVLVDTEVKVAFATPLRLVERRSQLVKPEIKHIWFGMGPDRLGLELRDREVRVDGSEGGGDPRSLFVMYLSNVNVSVESKTICEPV